MKRRIAILAAALAAASLGAHADGDPQRGKSLFMGNLCWTCHGTVGHGEPYGPKIAPKPLPWEAFMNQVRHPRGSKPHYEAKNLSDRDLGDIYAYVASIPAGPKASEIPLLK